jgi:hypothetical protein
MSGPLVPPLFRVAKGNPDAEELAAITAVLLGLAAGIGAEPEHAPRRKRAVAGWRRPERASAFDGPRTWRT